MTVSDWMTPDPVSVPPTASLFEVSALFRERRFRHVPVVEDGRLVGVVSDRDVLAASSPFSDTPSETRRDYLTLSTKAGALMTADPRTVAPDTPLAEAARAMVAADVSSLLVTTADGGLAGILTARDVLRSTVGT